jgi:hypothetical protein
MSDDPGIRLRMGVATWVRHLNWLGEATSRRIIPIEVWHGSEWMLRAWDFDKAAQRDFELDGFIFADTDRVEATPAPPVPTAHMIAEVDDTA